MTDEELVTRALVEKRGAATDAFEQLVERHEESLFRFLLLRCGSREEAEEIAQESFLRAFEKLARFDPRWSFRTWLFTLAKRIAVGRLRRARSEPLPDEPLVDLDRSRDPSQSSAEREEIANLWDLAARVLSREKRSALWLCYGEGLSHAEIARVLRRPRVTVRVLLFRARQELARALGPNDGTARADAVESKGSDRSPRSDAVPTPSGAMR